MVNILLFIMLIFVVIGKLGIELIGFVVFFVFVGVVIGMVLFGNL